MTNVGVQVLKDAKKALEKDLREVIHQMVFEFSKTHGIQVDSVNVNILQTVAIGYDPECHIAEVRVGLLL